MTTQSNTHFIPFEVQGEHTTTKGEAVIVPSYADGIQYALNNLGEQVITSKIAIREGYTIFENYSDSGSDEYLYFAVKF